MPRQLVVVVLIPARLVQVHVDLVSGQRRAVVADAGDELVAARP